MSGLSRERGVPEGSFPSRLSRWLGEVSRAGVAPAGDLFQSRFTALLEKPHLVPRVLEFMNIGPDLCLPGVLMHRRFAAGGAARVQSVGQARNRGIRLKLDKNATHFFDVFVLTDQM